MSYIKSFSEFISSNRVNESKTVEDKIKELARHLAFDKDIIKYLNTTRSKREIGWRDLLNKKIHGGDKEFITYITKNMVANLNPKITGPVSVKIDDGDFDNPDIEISSRIDDMDTNDKIDDINRRLEDVEDTLGINPDNEDTLEDVKNKVKKLGFNPIKRDKNREIIDEDEEEE